MEQNSPPANCPLKNLWYSFCPKEINLHFILDWQKTCIFNCRAKSFKKVDIFLCEGTKETQQNQRFLFGFSI